MDREESGFSITASVHVNISFNLHFVSRMHHNTILCKDYNHAMFMCIQFILSFIYLCHYSQTSVLN